MHVTFPPIIIVLGTKDLDGSRLMPERAGHSTTKVKINRTELIAFIRDGTGSQPMLHGPNKLAGPRSSMRHPPELCWAKMGSRALGQRLKPARCRAPMICLPLGMGRGPKHTAGSGGFNLHQVSPNTCSTGLGVTWALGPRWAGDVGCELFLRALYDPSATLSSLLERSPS